MNLDYRDILQCLGHHSSHLEGNVHIILSVQCATNAGEQPPAPGPGPGPGCQPGHTWAPGPGDYLVQHWNYLVMLVKRWDYLLEHWITFLDTGFPS